MTNSKIKISEVHGNLFDTNTRIKMFKSLHPDYTNIEIGKKFDVSRQSVSKIIHHGKFHRNLLPREIKLLVLTYYGNGNPICARCGFSDMRALTIHHINGAGSEHRKYLKSIKKSLYQWLLDENYPNGFETYCMNCQWIEKSGRSKHIRKNNIGNRKLYNVPTEQAIRGLEKGLWGSTHLIKDQNMMGKHSQSMCPKCKSKVIYIRTLTQEIVCRRCSSISPITSNKRVTNVKENKD